MKAVRYLPAMAAVAAGLTMAAQARADVIDFFLNQPECTGACHTLPSLIPNSSSIEVIVTGTTGTSGDYTGATVEFVAPSGKIDTPALINVKGSYHATVSIPGGVVGPGNEDHFGTFSAETGAVKSPTVTFTLTATDGNFWTDAANVLTPTTNFAAIYGHGFEAVTAAQDAGEFVPAPEPSTLALLGVGLLAIFGVTGFRGAGRRRQSA